METVRLAESLKNPQYSMRPNPKSQTYIVQTLKPSYNGTHLHLIWGKKGFPNGARGRVVG
jgi:hypothetical protein